MVPLPVTIHKHWIGYVAIALVAICLIGFLWVGLLSWIMQPGVDQGLIFQIAVIGMLSIAVAAAVLMYVYGLSYLQLTTQNVLIKNYVTPFASRDEQFEWAKVSRSTATKAGFFGTLFNYGTISAETEGGSIQAVITLMPNPEYWQAQIQQFADQAAPNA